MPRGGGKAARRVRSEGARKVVLAALAGNLAIALTKFAAYAFTRSTAIFTEGVHSLVDTADQVLLLIGQRRARRPPSPSHPFGYGMETYFWSFIVALMIFLVGGVAAVWQGGLRIVHPQPIARPLISFGVLAASALFEGLSFRTAYREFRAIVQGRDVPLVGFLKVSKDPNVFATLLEDGGALIGLGLAALGVAGATFAHLAWADGAASVLIGLLLIGIAIFLANEMRSLIAGESAAPAIEAEVREALRKADAQGAVTGVRTLHLGPETILVAIGWRLARTASAAVVEREVARLQACVRRADPRIVEVLFDIQPAAVSSAVRSSADDTAPRDRPARPRARRG
jgi:cation diffusion facilitator family transporter